MKIPKHFKLIIGLTALFVIVSILFMFGGNLFRSKGNIRNDDSTLMVEADSTTNEIKSGIVVEEDFICSCDSISAVGIVFSRIAYVQGISMELALLEGNSVLASEIVDSGSIEEQHRTFIHCALSGMKGKKLTVRIAPLNEGDTGLVIMMNQKSGTSFRFGKKTVKGTLCFSVSE